MTAIAIPAVPAAHMPLEFVRTLAPRIRECAAESRSAVATEITDALLGAGIYSLMVPTELGGGVDGVEAGPSLLIDVIEELAAADGSTGWAAMAQMTGAGTILAMLDREGVNVLLESPDWRVAGQAPPAGTAHEVDGGYKISGKFGFASGSSSAGWFFGGFTVKSSDGEPLLDEHGNRRIITCVVPRGETQLLGGWDVFGLVATASIDYAFTDVFVPHERVADGGVRQGDTFHTTALRLLTALGHTAVALGFIRSAMEEFARLALEKFRPPVGLLVKHEAVQASYAQWRAKSEAARAWAHHTFNQIFADAKAGVPLTESLAADSRLIATHCAYLATEITQAIYLLSGSDGLRNGPNNIIQRSFRDAHAGSQHMLTAPHVNIEAGRIYLQTPGMKETHRRILDHVFAPQLSS